MKEDALLEMISSRSRNGVFCMSRYPVTNEDDLEETLHILSKLEHNGLIRVTDRMPGGYISMFELI
ncbi:hypothetical protein SMZ97_003293 [Cronobacter turicensis]|uniref:hypothetical protein n=1 Tax=Cronobacter turicensis TaxID=413502 RepID=UPI001588175A|nr:hypothetical protein [Cronobacter turicensis]ELY4575657.1 hypothetical protein [Cronobacter turicensis]NUW55404.1 hypothetical protein [Cronobacter turicensis]